jgi:SAM-dependent methyltransferase
VTVAATEGCPVCGAGALACIRGFDAPSGHYDLYACPACTSQHWRPLVHPKAAYYEGEGQAMYRKMHEGRRSVEDPRFLRFLAEFAGERGSARVLDVGCSDGVLLEHLKCAGHEVWGLDIDDASLAVARRRGLDNLHRGSVDEFVDEARRRGLTFTHVTLFDVLEHLTDPVATLSGLRSVLADGGRLMGTVPNRRRFLANQMNSDFPPHHFFRFDDAALRGCLTRGGFAVRVVEAFQYGYTAITLLEAIRKRVRRPRRGPQRAPATGGGHDEGLGMKQRIANTIRIATTPVSALIEWPQRRGFKLYFSAVRR